MAQFYFGADTSSFFLLVLRAVTAGGASPALALRPLHARLVTAAGASGWMTSRSRASHHLVHARRAPCDLCRPRIHRPCPACP
ncbi:MAG: hypothetical protein DI563_15525 [Variovorax paradoxus]|uniref:Uncharacterized protein n=1 Tax=Variovorax paradoxus TaxID=34073 RepID=A0A2W5Q9D0_VARPD|nr:MAG: hypothetical protein DI563_15525 [Variovorax paradoxus]